MEDVEGSIQEYLQDHGLNKLTYSECGKIIHLCILAVKNNIENPKKAICEIKAIPTHSYCLSDEQVEYVAKIF